MTARGVHRQTVMRAGLAGISKSALLLLLSLAMPLSASTGDTEVSDSRLAVRLEEASGRFSLFAIDQAGERRSLLYAPDPRTSVLSIREDNRIHRMGDSAGFSRTAEVLPGSAAFVWRSSTLEIEQRLTTANGISGAATVDIRVLNRSETSRRVAVRYLLDTWLGEEGGVHFGTSAGEEIRTETRVQPDDERWYWVSGDAETSMYYVFSGGAGTEADSVVFANWKRLADARWDYRVTENRSFDLIPYAMNDSAAAVYYPEQTLSPGEEYHVRFLIGVGRSAPDVTLPSVAVQPAVAERAPIAPVPRAPAVPQRSPRATERPEERELLSELQRVNALLQDINRELISEDFIPDDRVQALEQRLYREQDSGGGRAVRPIP